MAAHPIAIVHDGVVEIPDEVKSDPRFQNGARLQLVPMESTENLTDWHRLGGIASSASVDPNQVLEQERQRELEQEERWRNA